MPTQYVLGGTTAPPAAGSLLGLPVVELLRVRVPDYLDTKDVVTTSGGRIVVHEKARWGERLSLGLTRALAASLGTRLPGIFVSTASPPERPTRQLSVDVATFEITDHQLILTATWTITDGSDSRTQTAERAAIVEALSSQDDNALVAAMSRAVSDLAAKIAPTVDNSLRPR
nr:PqiC family protein [Enhydrobacter aerosaccus]